MGNLAVLVGNGLSIACNPDLSVDALSKHLSTALGDYAKNDNTQVGGILNGFASRLHGPGDGFENVIGALQAASDALPYLQLVQLENVLPSIDANVHLTKTIEFCETLHRTALSIVLEKIAWLAHARAVLNSPVNTVRKFCQALRDTSTEAVSIATLNYDGLLHAGLLEEWGKESICDAARGTGSCSVTLMNDVVLKGHPLRDYDDFPDSRSCLINLHGSLGWVRNEAGESWKCDLGDLRDSKYWSGLRTGRAHCVPVVILTNQKELAVAKPPFNLLYGKFQKQLVEASRWLIVGCSLTDGPVRRTLREAWRMRRGKDTYIYVIDKGDRNFWQSKLEGVLGSVPPEHLQLDLSGIEQAIDVDKWKEWVRRSSSAA